jgi:hypothetical protein
VSSTILILPSPNKPTRKLMVKTRIKSLRKFPTISTEKTQGTQTSAVISTKCTLKSTTEQLRWKTGITDYQPNLPMHPPTRIEYAQNMQPGYQDVPSFSLPMFLEYLICFVTADDQECFNSLAFFHAYSPILVNPCC